jgi:hypothetical protein
VLYFIKFKAFFCVCLSGLLPVRRLHKKKKRKINYEIGSNADSINFAYKTIFALCTKKKNGLKAKAKGQ